MNDTEAPAQHGILADPAPSALEAAAWRQPVDYWRTCAVRLPGGELHETSRFTWFTSDFTTAPWFNQVMLTNVDAGEADAAIDERLAFFAERGRPMLWHVIPASRPADLSARLLSRGFHAVGSRLTMMTIELADLPNAEPPAGLEIECVSDEAGLERWFSGYIAGFAMAPEAARPFLDIYRGFGYCGDSPFRHYAGLLNGQAVASATLFVGAGVASVWHVGTAPAARRLGIGSAMTLAALNDGRRLGHRSGVLQASDDGVSIYRKLGFREYGQALQYRWTPAS